MWEDKLGSEESTAMFTGLLVVVLEANHIAIQEIGTRVDLSLGVISDILEHVLPLNLLPGNRSFQQVILREASHAEILCYAIIVDEVVHCLPVLHLCAALQRHVVGVHVDSDQALLSGRLGLVVTLVPEEFESICIFGMNEACGRAIEVSDQDPSSLHRDFHAVEILPDRDDVLPVMEQEDWQEQALNGLGPCPDGEQKESRDCVSHVRVSRETAAQFSLKLGISDECDHEELAKLAGEVVNDTRIVLDLIPHRQLGRCSMCK
jgi:hypothetical protein